MAQSTQVFAEVVFCNVPKNREIRFEGKTYVKVGHRQIMDEEGNLSTVAASTIVQLVR